MRQALGCVVVLLTGCGFGGGGGTDSDTDGYATCNGSCTSTLEVVFSDGRLDFEVALTGEDFNNFSLACPDGVGVGGSGQDFAYECLTAGFRLSMVDSSFPDTLEITADGESSTLSPDWNTEQVCNFSCNSAAEQI